MRFGRLTLLWKIWLSTSVALTALFAVTGWVLQRAAFETTARNLEGEVKAGFQAYDSLWKARAEMLASLASVLSSMPNVRAAFGTGDPATIRDTAGELWSRIAYEVRESAILLVTDPRGKLIAALGSAPAEMVGGDWPVVREAAAGFPNQASGFLLRHGELFQTVITPVYVDSPRGPALINVLVTGYVVNHLVAARLKELTGGSDFLFLTPGRVVASTLNERATAVLARKLEGGATADLTSDGVAEYMPQVRDLIDVRGRPVGKLCIVRSFEGVRQSTAELRRNVVLIWLGAVVAGLALTYLLARRIVEPVKSLDRAAAEVARQNYDHRVPVRGQDELSRLAATFNSMCASLTSAREELIRQERISTIGRLASSIVHDLRNPLAAIYGGAEMMVDTELAAPQMKRLAMNIYNSSRRIQEMLQDLLNVTRGRTGLMEMCGMREVVLGATESLAGEADSRGVEIDVEIPEELEVPLERARVERVFQNLVHNALEVMPEGGAIHIAVREAADHVVVSVEDTGPGISREIRQRLFQPFVSYGKKNGLGLGLALSRQTVLDHGGDIWVESEEGHGARFLIRLPRSPRGAGLPPVEAAIGR